MHAIYLSIYQSIYLSIYLSIQAPTKHTQNTHEKQAPRRLTPVVQDHDPARHPRNTHETPTRARNHHRKTLTTSERTRIIGQRSHCANFSSRWPPGRTDDGRTTHKFARRALATGESSRARSFARSHAHTQRKRKRNRNRFPGSGVFLTPTPQPPIQWYVCDSDYG